jgi:signal transduction histidine kinase
MTAESTAPSPAVAAPVAAADRRTGQGLVWLPLALALGFAVATSALLVVNGAFPLRVGVVASVAYAAVGSWIASHRGRQGLVPVLWAISASQGLVEFCHAYATRALDLSPDRLPGGLAAAWLSDWVWFPGYLLMVTLVLLLFPNGRLPSPRWRPVVWVVWASITVMALGAATSLPSLGSRVSMAGGEGEEIAALVGGAAFFVGVACAPICLASLVVRWRRSGGLERRQLKTFLFGAVLGVGALLTSATLGGSVASTILGPVAVVAVPAAIGVGVVRHHLFDIELVINRALVYTALTGLVVGGYVGSVTAAQWVFDRSGMLPSVLAAGVVAAAFQPARGILQRRVNRLLYGTRDDPYEVVRELGHQLTAAATPAEVIATLVDSIARALRVPHVRIESAGVAGRVLADAGAPVEGGERFRLVAHGETVGWLVIAPRSGTSELAVTDRRLLTDLAHHVAVAVHAALLAEDVQRSRERLRIALEDERRRIRRDVHDGLGPTLATVVMGLERLRNADPGGGDAGLVAELKSQTQEAITGMRALIDGLRPSPLDDVGLLDAIRLHADRLSEPVTGRPLDVTLEAPDALPDLPAAVEVAAYRIVLEALTNVARHARASRCTVRIDLADDLRLEVVDDGVGLPAAYTAGVGLRSMRERASELGGGTVVRRLEQGTSVSVSLPVVP